MLYCNWGWIPTCTLTVRAELLTRLPYLGIRRSDNDAILNAQLAALGALFAQFRVVSRLFGAVPYTLQCRRIVRRFLLIVGRVCQYSETGSKNERSPSSTGSTAALNRTN